MHTYMLLTTTVKKAITPPHSANIHSHTFTDTAVCGARVVEVQPMQFV